MLSLILCAAALACTPFATRTGDKTDTVVLENGNEIRGELKSLVHATLKLDTDSAGLISIEWDEVLSVTSPARFRFETVEGLDLVGTLPASTRERVLVIQTEDGQRHELDILDVVRIWQFDQSVWERVDGYFSSGVSFTKASDVAQYTLGAGISYYERDYSVDVDASLIVTDSKGEDTSRKADLNVIQKYYLGDRWFLLGAGLFQHNSELALDLRITAGAGPGRYLIQDQTQQLSAFGGLAVSHEVPEDESSTTELEGLLGSEYEIFISDTPETHLDLKLSFFPGITDAGRVRSNFSIDLKKELIEDFFFNVNFYLDYDSDPLSSDASKTDLGVVSGISYSW